MSDVPASTPSSVLPSSEPQVFPVPASPRAKRVRRIVSAVLAVLVMGAILSLWFYDSLPQRVDDQQTLVLGQSQFSPGSRGALRVVVRDAKGATPVPDAQVKVSMAPKKGGPPVLLFEGRSGPDGGLPVSFSVPEVVTNEQTLIVEARSKTGRDRVEQPITVARSQKLLLTTDKPVYQPGQTIHMRALAFSILDMRAAQGADIGFLVEDPKGNKVYRRTVQSSEFGVAAADLLLADEVLHGDYKISVSLADTTSEKTVNVKPYVLPKFAVKVNTDRSYYLPGERVEGTVQCDYFFGKPVAQGQVEIVGSVFDVEQVDVVRIQGQTNVRGAYRFAFDLPPYFAGRGLESDEAELSLQVTVVDQAEHAEQTSRAVPIAEDPILIEVVAEAGKLKAGVENKVYILTSYPDGRPARSELSFRVYGQPVRLSTGDHGLAEFSLTPPTIGVSTELTITARDERGQTVLKSVVIEEDGGVDVLLLRPDQATYRVGDTMHLVALTRESFGSIFLDIVREGQTLSTRSAPVEGGRAEFAVDLSGDLYGALALHAYKVVGDGSIVRDTRVVVVDAPRDLTTEIAAERDTYRPAETARLSFQTRAAGQPVEAVLGLSIVDESVFAVMEQDPGFAKLYFLLQKELLEPKYQVKGFTLPEVLTPTVDMDLQAAQDRAARAAWAPLQPGAFTMNVNSMPLKVEEAKRDRDSGLGRVANGVLLALIVVPIGLWVTTILGLRASGILGQAAKRWGLLTVVLLFGGPFVLFVLGWILSIIVGIVGEALLVLILALLMLGWLSAVVALAIYAFGQRDERARIVWLLVLGWIVLGVVLVIGLFKEAIPSQWLAAAAVLGYLGGLWALLLFGVGLYVEGRRWPGLSACAIALLFIPAIIGAAALPELARFVSLVHPLGNAGLYCGPVGWLTGCSPGYMDAPGGLLPSFGAPRVVRETVVMEKAVDRAGKAEAEPKPGEQAPRVRQFFPETLLWLPELKTDAGGFVALDVPLADSITTWRVTALASTQDGKLGFSNAGLRVFQDFFVDIDLPVALTQNDEVAIPVAIYNYLPQAQNVRLEVATAGPEGDWFTLQDEPTKSLRIEANDIQVVYFRIRVDRFGERAFQVTAYGDKMSDAIKRSVDVVPDGRLFRHSQSDWLQEESVVTALVPEGAIPGTGRIEVKVYPGVVSQVVEGLDKILRLPFG